MPQTAAKTATYADLAAVPPHLVGELLFGNLITHPRPVPRHSLAHYRLGLALGGTYDRDGSDGEGGNGDWIFLNEPELHLGPHVVVPDLAGVLID
jgi:hypothetical protein